MSISGDVGREISPSQYSNASSGSSPQQGVEPKQLEGRRIRVHGWIEQRGGPIIAAEAPEQIEFVE